MKLFPCQRKVRIRIRLRLHTIRKKINALEFIKPNKQSNFFFSAIPRQIYIGLYNTIRYTLPSFFVIIMHFYANNMNFRNHVLLREFYVNT